MCAICWSTKRPREPTPQRQLARTLELTLAIIHSSTVIDNADPGLPFVLREPGHRDGRPGEPASLGPRPAPEIPIPLRHIRTGVRPAVTSDRQTPRGHNQAISTGAKKGDHGVFWCINKTSMPSHHEPLGSRRRGHLPISGAPPSLPISPIAAQNLN